MKFSNAVLGAAAALAFVVATPLASAADLTYTFDQRASGADFGTGPYGSVMLTQTGANVLFSVALRSDLNFTTTGNEGSKAVFAFNASGVVASEIVNIVDASNQTFRVVAPGNDSPFGSFTFGLLCATNCSNGGSGGGYPDPLTFTVQNATLGDFAGLSTAGAHFAADVFTTLNVTGATGAIGAVGAPVPAVPEPGTYALMFAGLGAMAFVARRRKPD